MASAIRSSMWSAAVFAATWFPTAASPQSAGLGSTCRIDLIEVVRIDDVDRGPGQFTPWVATHSGRLFFVETFDEASIREFDLSTGAFVRQVGRRGEGPGEFLRIAGIRAVADSLYVLDKGNTRLTVLGPDLQLVRDARVPVRPIDLQPLSVVAGVGVLVNGWAHTAELAGAPIHLFDQDGTRVRSFGTDRESPYRSPNARNGFRHGAAVSGARHWTVRLNQYLLEQWDLETGRRLKAVEIEDEWPGAAYRNGQPIQAAPPLIFALHLDRFGRAWIVGRETVGEPQPPIAHGADQSDLAEVVDLRIDVVDLTAGKVVASTTLPDYAGGFLETGQLFSFRSMDSPGQMSVWDPSVTCSAPQSQARRR